MPPDNTYFMNLAADLKPDDVPYQPWAKALAEQRQSALHKDDPPGAVHAARHGGGYDWV
jgi:hypothetical protein